ncbi:MAG: glucose-6-phosphate dehydrogenase [Planctomycetaceae bacterium]
MANTSLTAGDTTILIFGASGDLTARKLIPALFQLFQQGYLNVRSPVIGVARREKSDAEFRDELRASVVKPDDADAAKKWDEFAKQLFYRRVDISNTDDYVALRESCETLEQRLGTAVDSPRVVYLATAPAIFDDAVRGLHAADMIPMDRKQSDRLRVVVEKPFGHDFASAETLNEQLTAFLKEDQIYRIDHYLGKETVQNILLFRFGNAFFEPLLNRNHVDNVQITVAESLGMEGGRGGYYDTSGALRDVLQNHMLQLLCLVAMDPPALFQGREIRDEKMKVLQALRPGAESVRKWAVRGQYGEGLVAKQRAPAYREEDRVPPKSNRETYVAMHAEIDNWRWAGVPFYLRTGKRLPERVTEIVIQFKHPPLNLFSTVECDGDLCSIVEARPNQLVLRIQPKESIFLKFSTKRPGMQYQVQPVTMDFDYEDHFTSHLPEAYERLLLDVMRGDSTLFTRSDELLAAWKFVDPVLKFWESGSAGLEFYPAGTWGPAGADRLLTESGHHWRVPKVQ